MSLWRVVLRRYGLQPSSACLAEERHLPLYPELVKDYPVEYIAGGAGQNSIRAAQVRSRPRSPPFLSSSLRTTSLDGALTR